MESKILINIISCLFLISCINTKENDIMMYRNTFKDWSVDKYGCKGIRDSIMLENRELFNDSTIVKNNFSVSEIQLIFGLPDSIIYYNDSSQYVYMYVSSGQCLQDKINFNVDYCYYYFFFKQKNEKVLFKISYYCL